jgi:hypothetical protein
MARNVDQRDITTRFDNALPGRVITQQDQPILQQISKPPRLCLDARCRHIVDAHDECTRPSRAVRITMGQYGGAGDRGHDMTIAEVLIGRAVTKGCPGESMERTMRCDHQSIRPSQPVAHRVNQQSVQTTEFTIEILPARRRTRVRTAKPTTRSPDLEVQSTDCLLQLDVRRQTRLDREFAPAQNEGHQLIFGEEVLHEHRVSKRRRHVGYRDDACHAAFRPTITAPRCKPILEQLDLCFTSLHFFAEHRRRNRSLVWRCELVEPCVRGVQTRAQGRELSRETDRGLVIRIEGTRLRDIQFASHKIEQRTALGSFRHLERISHRRCSADVEDGRNQRLVDLNATTHCGRSKTLCGHGRSQSLRLFDGGSQIVHRPGTRATPPVQFPAEVQCIRTKRSELHRVSERQRGLDVHFRAVQGTRLQMTGGQAVVRRAGLCRTIAHCRQRTVRQHHRTVQITRSLGNLASQQVDRRPRPDVVQLREGVGRGREQRIGALAFPQSDTRSGKVGTGSRRLPSKLVLIELRDDGLQCIRRFPEEPDVQLHLRVFRLYAGQVRRRFVLLHQTAGTLEVAKGTIKLALHPREFSEVLLDHGHDPVLTCIFEDGQRSGIGGGGFGEVIQCQQRVAAIHIKSCDEHRRIGKRGSRSVIVRERRGRLVGHAKDRAEAEVDVCRHALEPCVEQAATRRLTHPAGLIQCSRLRQGMDQHRTTARRLGARSGGFGQRDPLAKHIDRLDMSPRVGQHVPTCGPGPHAASWFTRSVRQRKHHVARRHGGCDIS